MEKTLFVWLLLVTLMITIPVFAVPPSAPTPVGSGSGDFSGPASATDGNFVSFDGVGGKTGKDSGSKATDFLGASAKAADADKLDNHDSTYFQVAYAALSSIGGLTESAGGFPYFTADDTWAVLGIGTAYQILHVNSGATAPDWTSTLGSSSTRLTMGYFTNLEITNSPTVNGTALSALYQPLDSTLTGLAGIAITVDGNNVTFPGAIITTAEDGSRRLAVLANTVGVDATSDAFELYPDSDNTWKLNQNGTEYTPTLSPTAGQVTLFGTSAARTWTIPDVNVTIPANPIGGTLGATANVIPKASGTGTATLQASGITEDGTNVDVGALNLVTTGQITGLTKIQVLTNTSGTHDGSNDAAILTDSGESFTTSQFVGMTLYNITDGSSCTVTANDGTTVTCTLAGGTDNNWDTDDAWQVGPGSKQAGSMWLVTAAATIRHPATAKYTACYMANGTNKLTIDMASDSMVFKGTLNTAVTTLDAGDSVDTSGSTADDYICIINVSTTDARGLGKRGTLADGGAS